MAPTTNSRTLSPVKNLNFELRKLPMPVAMKPKKIKPTTVPAKSSCLYPMAFPSAGNSNCIRRAILHPGSRFRLHTIVDKLQVCNPIISAHGYAQAGRTERQADQTPKGPDSRAVCGDFRLEPAIHQWSGAGPSKSYSCHTPRIGNSARRDPSGLDQTQQARTKKEAELIRLAKPFSSHIVLAPPPCGPNRWKDPVGNPKIHR